MAISEVDMSELRRISTNAYDKEYKECFKRVLRGIAALNAEVQSLRGEKTRLEKELSEANTK